MKSRVARYGNNQSAQVNRHYVDYHRRAQAAFDPRRHPISEEAQSAAEELRAQGFLNVPPLFSSEEAATLKRKVDDAFARRENCYPYGTGSVRLIDGYEQLPDVVDHLAGHIEEVLHAYYRSHFKIYAVTVYRHVPDEAAPHSSFLWHFDNAPDQQLKLMVYLDDVVEETGAFRFKSREQSERARKLGFWHRDQYELGRPVFDDPESTRVLEGPPGTSVIFQPGRVVHRGVAPRRDHRDVAVLVINPSLIYWREHLARNRHLLSTNAGLCMDLDRDTPQHIGYRF
jgi:hypothetical protein